MNWKKALAKLILLLITLGFIAGLSSCSVQKRAQRHLRRAVKLDPSIFNLDTVRTVTKVKTPPLTWKFNCEELQNKGEITLHVPREYETPDGKKVNDTGKVVLKSDENGNIQAISDCPPVEYIEIKVPAPYPVKINPTFWEKLEYIGGGVLGLAFVLIILWLIRRMVLF